MEFKCRADNDRSVGLSSLWVNDMHAGRYLRVEGKNKAIDEDASSSRCVWQGYVQTMSCRRQASVRRNSDRVFERGGRREEG